MITVFLLLAGTVAMFASDRVRLDVVALLAVVALPLCGIMPVQEAFAGFGDPVIVLIAALFVVGEGLARSGVAAAIGARLLRFGTGSEATLLALMMLAVAALSAVMSSTGAVAIFIPVATGIALRLGTSPSRLLMPLAVAALIGGMLTLIGTPPNMVAAAQLTAAGLPTFSFFAFTPIGALILALGIAWMIAVGRHTLPDRTPPAPPGGGWRSMEAIAADYAAGSRIARLRMAADSPLDGQSLAEARLISRHGLTVVGIERQGRFATLVLPALIDTAMRAGDVLLAAGAPAAIAAAAAAERLESLPFDTAEPQLQRELGLAEMLVPPGSSLAGQTPAHAELRRRLGVAVVGLRRQGAPLPSVGADTVLEAGDALLVAGGWEAIARLRRSEPRDLLVLGLPRELAEVAPARRQAPLALAITAVMLVLMIGNLVPTAIAAMMAALAMVVGRCVSMDEAYRAVNWQSLILIAGMLPMGTALERTGGAALIADGLVGALGGLGPLVLMAGLFALTSTLSQFISNTATTVLLAPIAIRAAQEMGLAPQGFVMAVAIAASTAFATPVASPVNALVLGPGRYRFTDFVRIGVPLQVLALLATLATVPWLFPLRP